MLRRWPSIALVVVALALAFPACHGRAPDVGAFDPVLREDGRVVELLQEADALANRNPHDAARDLRETVLPRARANWEAAGRMSVEHPRANALRRELVRVTSERVDSITAYAAALDGSDVQALHDAIARQVVLDRAMDRLEADVQAAARAPADRGCRAGT